jgi:hypothetical protein
MTLLVTNIPEDTAQLARWLERHLVGLDLGRLVAELNAVHRRAGGEEPSVTEALRGHLERVYAAGLGALPRPLLRHLLTHPALLAELQELVLTHGGPYWDQVGRDDPAVTPHVELGRARLGLRVQPSTAEHGVAGLPWYRRASFGSLATAAALLLAVGAWERLRPAPAAQGWGWDRPGALAAGVSREGYLNGLADAAEEWFKKRPETPSDLAKRLAQLRQGCSALLLSDHPPLPEEDRKWLKERCRKWAAKFEAQLAAVESGKEVQEVRAEADATVNQLVKALRERAQAS